MGKLLLLGDEAIAQGGMDAGLSGVYSYPGTPSTEITEYIQKSPLAIQRNIHSQWSANEKTAMESALGMSYSGKRAMVCMKHVGLNVASDAFVNSAITGANGGLVVVAADDPSMHSSQNEQDSRFYGQFAMVPIFEPSSQQEAYDMAYSAFDFSEKYKIPVLLRLTTRLAHSRSSVERKKLKPQNEISLPTDLRQYILLPQIARKRYKVLLDKQNNFGLESERSSFNKLFDGEDKRIGIITCGIAYNYLMENLDGSSKFPILKIGQYPLPRTLLKKIFDECEKIIVLEDGYPFVESLLKGYNSDVGKISGKLDGLIPRDGELDPNIVGVALGKNKTNIHWQSSDVVVSRPPVLCTGCPHIDSFLALKEAMEDIGFHTFPDGIYSDKEITARIFSDIGCYTLGALPPYECISSCVDMGASITMAKGAADSGLIPAVAVIGDSTFSHSGITGLLDAVNENSPITVIILDNDATGMTGGQSSSGSGKIENICKGIGVDPSHIRKIIPLKRYHKENVEVIKEELQYPGVSVIIPERECILTVKEKKKSRKNKGS